MVKKKKSLWDLDWAQTKKHFPEMNPYGDLDSDGVLNKFDCKPLDPTRHGFWKRLTGRQTSEEYQKEKRQKIGRKVAMQLKEQKRIGGLARGYEKLEKEKEKLREYRRTIQERKPFGVAMTKGEEFLKGIATQRRRQLVVARDIRRPLVGAGKGRTGKGRGRPKGSYDPRYAAYGGVYGYRKVLSARLRQEKLKAMQEASLSPKEQTILDKLRAQERAKQISPERRVIVDTTGKAVPKTYAQEIEDAANLVP